MSIVFFLQQHFLGTFLLDTTTFQQHHHISTPLHNCKQAKLFPAQWGLDSQFNICLDFAVLMRGGGKICLRLMFFQLIKTIVFTWRCRHQFRRRLRLLGCLHIHLKLFRFPQRETSFQSNWTGSWHILTKYNELGAKNGPLYGAVLLKAGCFRLTFKLFGAVTKITSSSNYYLLNISGAAQQNSIAGFS